jgi:predicted alpha/beta-fold hydrolase
MSYNPYFFESNIFLRNKFIQTILGSIVSGNTNLPERKLHKVIIGQKSELVTLELPSVNPEAPVILLIHGLGGSSESSYIRRIARKLWIRGFTVFMMNQRGSGLGIGLCDQLWNGGSSDDLDMVLKYIEKMYPNNFIDILGFSLSGNILLKYLGEKKITMGIRKAFAVNPPIDLKRTSYVLSKTKCGRVFNDYYMKQIYMQMEAMGECFPDTFIPSEKSKTILEFDDAYTAPVAGYKNADDYYAMCSAKNFLEDIAVPTTILCAMDDPFIEPSIFKSIRMSRAIELNMPENGGHMGYLSRKTTPWGDNMWMDFILVDSLEG